MGHEEDDWEQAVDQWRAKRQQKRPVHSSDRQFVSASLDLNDATDSSNDFFSSSQPQPKKKPQIKTFQQMVAEKEERAKRNGVVHVKEDSRLIKEMDYLPVLKESQPSTPLVSILASSNTSTPSPEKEAPPLSNNSLVNASPVNDYSLIDKSVSRKSLDQNVEPELGVAYKPFSNFSQPNGTNERSRGNSGSVYSPPYQVQVPEAQPRKGLLKNGVKKPPPPKVAPKPKKCKSPDARPEGRDKLNTSGTLLSNSGNETGQKIPVTFFYFMPSAIEKDEKTNDSSNGDQRATPSPYMNSEMASYVRTPSSAKDASMGDGAGGTLLLTVSQNNQDAWNESQNGFGFGLSGANGSPVKITGVVSDVSSANLCNLREGDEILSINGEKVQSLSHDQVVAIMSEAVQSGNICLRINRSGLEVTCQTMDDPGSNPLHAFPSFQHEQSSVTPGKVSLSNGDLVPVSKQRSLTSGPLAAGDSWTSSNFDAQDAIIVEDVYMPDLQSIPNSSIPTCRTPVANSAGQVSSSKDFFEKMKTQEEEDIKARSEKLKKSRKDQEILERQLEAQRGRKYNTNEPVNYSFTIPDVEDSTESSKDNDASQSSRGDKSSSNQSRESNRPDKLAFNHEQEPNRVDKSLSNHSQESKGKLDNGLIANSSRAGFILGSSVADVDKFLDDDLTSEMEEFEAEFASQQEQMMRSLQEKENAGPGNLDMQLYDDEEPSVVEYSRDQSFTAGGTPHVNRRDPVEDVIAPHRAPSRASGVIAPASFTPQNQSLNTSVESQESLPTPGARTGEFIPRNQSKGQDERDNSAYIPGVSSAPQVHERQAKKDDEGGNWAPSLSGPVHSQRPTIMFDPTGGTSQPKRFNTSRSPQNDNEEDLSESFTTAKKSLDRKFREQKRKLYNLEAERIEQDQIQLNLDEEKLKKQDKNTHNWEKLNALKLNFAEDQKMKDQQFEDSVEDLKRKYHDDLAKLCIKYNRQNYESYVESDMRLNRTAKAELVDINDQSPNDQAVGNLSPRKYDLVKRWAEDTSQNMENNTIDVSKEGLELAYPIEPKAITHNVPVLHATETPPRKGQDQTDSGNNKNRVPLIAVGNSYPKSDGQRSRNGSDSHSRLNSIKKRPISGITKNDQGKLQSYYTPVSPRSPSKSHDNSFSKDVQNFNSWLDSLRGPGNPSMPKISRPKAENFVERYDLPNEGDSVANNEPLPQNVINAIFARLDPNSSKTNRSSNRKPLIRPDKKSNTERQSREKEKDVSASNRTPTPSNLRKWKSAPMDVNEIVTPAEEIPPLEQYPSFDVSSQENLWLASPEKANFTPQFPTNRLPSSDKGSKNNGFRNSAYKPLPRVPVPLENENYMNLPDPRIFQPRNDFRTGSQDRLDFDREVPPSLPPRSPMRSYFKEADTFRNSGPPQHFQEMSVDAPGSRPTKWNPTKNGHDREDPKASVPWNSRSMDHLNSFVDPASLNRKFQFRDAHDPHGFKTAQRSKQYHADSPSNMRTDSTFWNSQRTSYSHISTSYSQFSTFQKNRIPGLSEVHLQEDIKQQNKSRRISSREPCTKCGVPLGKGSAVVVESMNLLFHHDCFYCSVCKEPLKCGDVGTNIKVKGSSVHCESCGLNDGGYQITSC